MEHDEAALLLGAYALHALDDRERLRVAAHLGDCTRCCAEARGYERIAGLLGDAGEPHDSV